jgi:S-adenosylmethionine:diacylglycerol 3-amino-3-carboxypropyl transferase
MTEEKLEIPDPRGFVDRHLTKLVSRKLLVWATATYALFAEVVPPSDWIVVCLLYIGSQGAVDMVSTYIRAKNGE